MNKNSRFVLFTFLIVGLFIALFSTNISAQNKVAVNNNSRIENATTDRILQSYIDISSLPMEKRQAIFSDLSAEDKAGLFKLHLSFQFVKRPNLTKEQRELILDSIPMITPQSYNPKNLHAGHRAQEQASVIETKARKIFPMREVFEIFAKLGGNSDDQVELKKYQLLTASPYISERRAAFGLFSPKEKSSVMKIHLAYQIATRSLLREQNEFIVNSLFSIGPDFYSFEDGTPERDKVDEILRQINIRILDFFQKKEAYEIFVSFGGRDDTPVRTRSKGGTVENQGYLCSCSLNSDYCNWWYENTSCESDPTCTQRRNCGTFGSYYCNGHCIAG